MGRAGSFLFALCLCGSCANEAARTVGHIPENPTRARSNAPGGSVAPAAPAKPTRADLIAKHDTKTREPTVEAVDPADARIGVATTHLFHKARCKALEGVPVADQVRFTSSWDGLDSGYSPCELCRASK